jgi:hypothetical protein|tara:strand:+ start:307 stop:552 length:246 start_codon:yes stop_codon:yes gene_type:complete
MEEQQVQELMQIKLILPVVCLGWLEELHNNIKNITQVQYVPELPLGLPRYSYQGDLGSLERNILKMKRTLQIQLFQIDLLL